MIEAARFEHIKQRHGAYASWAVWAPAGASPKSNIGDLGIFDRRANPSLLDTLKPHVAMVGLNISRVFSDPFQNFHDRNPRANDFKIRFAFTGTPYYGAYMTDVIKGMPVVDSALLLKHLKMAPAILSESITLLRQELEDLGATRPLLLAFGGATHTLLADRLPRGDYSQLIRLTHYSQWMAQDLYRETVHAEIRRCRGHARGSRDVYDCAASEGPQ